MEKIRGVSIEVTDGITGVPFGMLKRGEYFLVGGRLAVKQTIHTSTGEYVCYFVDDGSGQYLRPDSIVQPVDVKISATKRY
jgi:hypothetical protein